MAHRVKHDGDDDRARRVFLNFNQARNPHGRPCRGRHRPVFIFMQAGKQPVFCVEKVLSVESKKAFHIGNNIERRKTNAGRMPARP